MGKSKIKLFSIIAVIIALIATLSFAGCKTAATETTAAETTAAAKTTTAAETTAAATTAAETTAAAKKFKIALSNNFMGNDWRQQMEKVVQEVALKSPYKEKLELTIVNVESTPEAQSESIDALAQQGYDAILVDAGSPTALNPAIERAAAKGIIIVSFDQLVTSEVAWKVGGDWDLIPKVLATYLVKVLDGKGNIAVDRGLPGVPISIQLLEGVKKVFSQYPDIKIVGEFDGSYGQGPVEQGMDAVLAANPKIDGVFTQSYTDAVARSLKKASHPMVPMIGSSGYNGEFLSDLENNIKAMHGTIAVGNSAVALQVALDILEGKNVEKNFLMAPVLIATDTSYDVGTPYLKIELDKTAFADFPTGFTWPVLPPDFPVQLTPEEALVK